MIEEVTPVDLADLVLRLFIFDGPRSVAVEPLVERATTPCASRTTKGT